MFAETVLTHSPVSVQEGVDRFAQCSRPFSVNDPDRVHPGQRGVVEVFVHFFEGLFDRQTPEINFATDIPRFSEREVRVRCLSSRLFGRITRAPFQIGDRDVYPHRPYLNAHFSIAQQLNNFADLSQASHVHLITNRRRNRYRSRPWG